MNCCNDYGECRQGSGCPVREREYISLDYYLAFAAWVFVATVACILIGAACLLWGIA